MKTDSYEKKWTEYFSARDELRQAVNSGLPLDDHLKMGNEVVEKYWDAEFEVRGWIAYVEGRQRRNEISSDG